MKRILAASVIAFLALAVLAPGRMVPSDAAVASPVAQAPEVQLPTIPAPVPVELDAGTTAFLVLDLLNVNCSARPGCVASLPAVAAFLGRARGANVEVVYSLTTAPGAIILPEVAPHGDEPRVASSADKVFDTELNEILVNAGIDTVVIVGTAASGAVLYTSFGASTRGYTVVVAEDGISATTDFELLFTRYQLLNQPGFGNPQNNPLQPRAVTLSSTDLISFR